MQLMPGLLELCSFLESQNLPRYLLQADNAFASVLPVGIR